jgi:hypothetical protein
MYVWLSEISYHLLPELAGVIEGLGYRIEESIRPAEA